MTATRISHIKAVCSDSKNNVFIHNYPVNSYYSRGKELKLFKSKNQELGECNNETVDLNCVIVLKTLTFVVNPTDIEQIFDQHKLKLPKIKQIQFNNPSAILGSEGLFEILYIPPKYYNMGFQIGDWCIPLENDNFGTWSTFTTVKDIKSLLKIKPVNVNNDYGTPIVSSNLDIYSCSILSVNSLAAYTLLNEIVKEWNDDLEQDYIVINLPNSQMGKLLLQMAKYKGIKSIAVLSDKEISSEEEISSILFKYGATYVISESKCKSKHFLETELPKTLGQHGRVRLALDAISGESTYHLANMLSENGKIVTYGASSPLPSQMPTDKLIFDNCQHIGFWMSREQKQNPSLKVNVLKKILPLFEKGILKMPTDNIQEIVWDYANRDDTIFLRELKKNIDAKKKVLVRIKH